MTVQSSKKPTRVVVIQKFSASREKIYDSFFNPKIIAQWMFGPKLRDEKILHIHTDPQIGGKFSFLVERNGEKMDHTGQYLTLQPPNHLTFTWSMDPNALSHVYVDIDLLPNGCELTLTHEIDPEWVPFASSIQDGWSKMLRVLNTVLG